MIVNSVTKTAYGDEITKLSAIYSGDKNAEDNTYSKATPSASLEITISNPAAQGFLVPGKSYYLDFNEAP